MSSSIRELSFKLIERYFEDNPEYLVSHHLESFNDFYGKRIFDIFRQNNPIKFLERVEGEGPQNEVRLYLGGKTGDKLYYGSPVIYDEHKTHLMYPNDARLRSMTYGMSIHFDVEVEMTYYIGTDKKERTFAIEKVFLGMFPIMVGSKYCILSGLTPEVRYNMGECKHDYGGYFIIDGKEKSVLPQETFADNMLYVRANAKSNDYSHSAEIRSVSEDTSKHTRTTSVKRVAPSASFANEQIVVDVPNVKKPVPLFILMRALGIVSDKAIVEACLLDTTKYASYVDLLIPSVHDASMVFSQETALRYIATFTKRETIDGVLDILANYFLPHVGDMNFRDKALFVGHMVLNLLKVVAGDERPTDRDSFKFKRVELTGVLLYDLFREYYQIYKATVGKTIDKEFYYHAASYEGEQFVNLIEANATKLFAERAVETGVKRAFKGKWGATPHTSRIGIVQDLNRLSWFTFISQLRKIILPLDASAKVVGPRHLNSSQWGLVDPVDTPDGGHIGLHKHLSICTVVTSGESAKPLIAWMREHLPLMLLQECATGVLATHTKVFVNGNWIGVVAEPLEIREQMVHLRRRGDPILSVFTSIRFDSQRNELLIYTDSGRLMRPIYPVVSVPSLVKAAEAHTQGFVIKKTWSQLLGQKNTDSALLTPKKGGSNNAALIEYLDTSESESALIAMTHADVGARTTHLEIDPSLLFGVMGNSIIFPEFNQFPRDVFSCGQSRQACSMYHTNYQMRMDKMGVVLNYGQTPLVKSRYLKHINNEDMPYGVNTVVAIMSYTGYNVEDAILINKGALDRGLFSTTYFTTVEAREETAKISNVDVNTVFTDVMASTRTITGLKPGYDYSALDASGLCREGTPVHDKIMVIGALTTSSASPLVAADASTGTKKGQLGVVDKSFMTDNEEGTRLAKVRIREIRVPNLGDKMASRAGQKGTIGLVIPEEDMPFTADGVRPDLIINPHALPSRMTIGQLVESILGLIGAHYGGFGDCTAFSNKGSNAATYGRVLVNAGFHSSGCHVMYNGMTGQPVESDIYMGPTYYMRLKHMVKDKINYRGKGPNQALTRQPVQGRANDGGLRIGEMEKDSIVSHGMTAFMTNTFMQRSDAYKIAICNQTGFIAAYNPERGLFLSPAADGVKFLHTPDGQMNVEQISKFGRSFSILDVPYSFKLLLHELQAMGVHMRIITDSNIQQLENLANATDVKIHLGTDVTDASVKAFTANLRHKLASSTKRPAPAIHRSAAPQPKPMPKYEIHSPVGPPPQIPQFIPQTPEGTPPQFIPQTPEGTPPQTPEGTSPQPQTPTQIVVMQSPTVVMTGNTPQQTPPSPEFAPYSPYVEPSQAPEKMYWENSQPNQIEPNSESPVYNPTEDLFKVDDDTAESDKAEETTKKININPDL